MIKKNKVCKIKDYWQSFFQINCSLISNYWLSYDKRFQATTESSLHIVIKDNALCDIIQFK